MTDTDPNVVAEYFSAADRADVAALAACFAADGVANGPISAQLPAANRSSNSARRSPDSF
jgi:ketosteroid isomerase-like protein